MELGEVHLREFVLEVPDVREVTGGEVVLLHDCAEDSWKVVNQLSAEEMRKRLREREVRAISEAVDLK